MSEELLKGGLIESVARLGDTVRRARHPWTPAIHELLRHLAAKGFPAPRPLGFDEKDREVVSFIPGEAALWPWPHVLLEGDGPWQVGRMLRRFHDAVANFVPHSEALCCVGPFVLGPGQIACHGDFGPYNLLWRGDELVGVIDWDLAAPGLPVSDLAFAAWQIVPLRPDDWATQTGLGRSFSRRERLAALMQGYGFSDRRALLSAALETMSEGIRRITTLGKAGKQPWQGYLHFGLHERALADYAWLEAYFDDLAAS
jgi:Ser/Thr protein kinase RdoA (MazF antagonist)